MCFSAGASFSASVLLGITGIISVKKAESSAQKIFAGIPLIFAFQQFTEGLLWLSLTHSAYASWQSPVSHVFIVIAQIIWPLWVPLSILLLEKDKIRKRALSIILGIGITTSIFLAGRILFYDLSAKISGHHIKYVFNFPETLSTLISIFYIVPTILSPFFSGIKRMYVLGLLNLLSFVVTYLFYKYYLVSVWCFFAAIISAIIIFIIHELNYKKYEHAGPQIAL